MKTSMSRGAQSERWKCAPKPDLEDLRRYFRYRLLWAPVLRGINEGPAVI